MPEMRNTRFIQEITFEDAKKATKGKKNLILKPEYKYFAIVRDGEILSLLGFLETPKGTKIHCNYTIPPLRGQGLFSNLLQYVIEANKGKRLYADCLQSSKEIYLSQGFSLREVKHYKSFDLYCVEREGEKK